MPKGQEFVNTLNRKIFLGMQEDLSGMCRLSELFSPWCHFSKMPKKTLLGDL
jgi:hypothetical protein